MAKAKSSRASAGKKAEVQEVKTKEVTAEVAPVAVKSSGGTTVRRFTASSRRTLRERVVQVNLQFGAMLAEFIGSFVLAFVVLATGNGAVYTVIAFLVLTLLLGKLSGGHINPVVTVVMMAMRQIAVVRGITYLLAQALGAMAALIAVNAFINSGTPMVGANGLPFEVFKVQLPEGTWEPFMAEMLACAVFGFGIAATLHSRRTGLEAAFMLGGALLLAYFVAVLGSGSILNPAAALATSAFGGNDWGWDVLGYLVGPLVGGVVGAYLYRLLQWDVENTAPDAG